MRTLLVAIGGGGDAITAAALAGPLRTEPPVMVTTYSWDRLMIDPLPGPRVVADFTGLYEPAAGVHEVLATTRPVPPAGSSLPRLAAELPARLLLLDPTAGAVGMAEQLLRAAAFCGATSLTLVDVGGDVLTDGHDPGLRSPLADQLALAAAVRSGLPTRLLITGAGLDGELPVPTITRRLSELGGQPLESLTAEDIEPVRHAFAWHPSEASGLLAAAALGLRGRVEVRDAADQVDLTDGTTAVFAVDAARAAAVTPSCRLVDSKSLSEAETIVRQITGLSEIRYETDKALMRAQRQPRHPTMADLDVIDRHAAEAAARGADYISLRRLAELTDATSPDSFASLIGLLTLHRSDCRLTSIYRTTRQH